MFSYLTIPIINHLPAGYPQVLSVVSMRVGTIKSLYFLRQFSDRFVTGPAKYTNDPSATICNSRAEESKLTLYSL